MTPRGERVAELLGRLQRIHLPAGAPEVCRTIARELRREFAARAAISEGGRAPVDARTLVISAGRLPRGVWRGKIPARWVLFGAGARGPAHLAALHACHLYAYFRYLAESAAEAPVPELRRGLAQPAFAWQRPVWDIYFSQSARGVRNLDREDYARQMARYGFTHLEVNSLAAAEGMEDGVPGEVYPRFYTYCPALDQFTDSFLNRGIYPRAYLRANLRRLQDGCRLAARYGLVPTLTCFEPRSVPDRLLARYPELRGARVDHPFRSFKPRFNLAVSHPLVRRHYRELIQNLLRAVPAIGCLAVWTNDSGAGFEFTRSLYVGANGSAYLVREWSDPDVFARAAGRNAAGFLRLLQESGAEIHPDFRVTTRLEPFTVERAALLEGLGHGVDVEVTSLFDRGWQSPYGHPLYRDCTLAPFTIYNNAFSPEEGPEIRRLARRGCRTHVFHAHGPVNNFEPLLNVPAPWLMLDKLRALKRAGAEYLAHLGGVAPPAAVPWNVNEELFRAFQFDPRLDSEQAVAAIARRAAGPRHGRALARAWRLIDRAIRAFHPHPLYFSWGVWYRMLTRPLVPDIERIPEKERRYYEDHILSTHHNPQRFDLRRDVLFDLMPPHVAARAVARNDQKALPLLERALAVLAAAAEHAGGAEEGARRALLDQLDRARALRCFIMTQRNVAAWIAGVHGFLAAANGRERAACRARLRAMVRLELENARELLCLWEEGRTEFMAVAARGQTTFIHGSSFGADLRRKIRLMERHGNDRPHIDPDVMWRIAGPR